jgi:hypothetical protein
MHILSHSCRDCLGLAVLIGLMLGQTVFVHTMIPLLICAGQLRIGM